MFWREQSVVWTNAHHEYLNFQISLIIALIIQTRSNSSPFEKNFWLNSLLSAGVIFPHNYSSDYSIFPWLKQRLARTKIKETVGAKKNRIEKRRSNPYPRKKNKAFEDDFRIDSLVISTKTRAMFCLSQPQSVVQSYVLIVIAWDDTLFSYYRRFTHDYVTNACLFLRPWKRDVSVMWYPSFYFFLYCLHLQFATFNVI